MTHATPPSELVETSEPEPASRRGALLRRGGAAVVGVLVAILASELAVRALNLAPPAVTKRLLVRVDSDEYEYHCYPSNPSGGFQPTPSLEVGDWQLFKVLQQFEELPLDVLPETPWCVEYHHGTRGTRGPSIASTPAPGVVRISGVGDSFALGEGVRFEHTLFEQMELLAPGTEIVNVGQSGANLPMELPALRWAADNYACRRSILVLIPNDVELTDELKRTEQGAFDLINLREERLRTGESRPWFARHLRVGHLIDQALRIRELTELTIANYRAAHDPARNGENLAKMQRELRDVAASPGVHTVVVIYPLMASLGDYPLTGVHETLMRMARTAGLPALDLAPFFAGMDERALHVHPSDHHPNAAAHGIAARAIVDWLRADVPGFLPQ